MFVRHTLVMVLLSSIAVCQSTSGPRSGAYEARDGMVLSNGRLELTVLTQGSGIAGIVTTDVGEKLNPLWNPLRLARDAEHTADFTGVLGHFVCVDGFGQPSAEERAAGLPEHGEAHLTRFKVNADAATNSVSLSGLLPIVQETFSRTFRTASGEIEDRIAFPDILCTCTGRLPQVDDVTLENGSLTIEDKSNGNWMVLAASRGL